MQKYIKPILVAVLVLTVGLTVVNRNGIGSYLEATYNQALYYSPCEVPIRYRIDSVDKRFKLTKEKFTDSVNQAAEVWNMAYGQTVFAYDENGALSISMHYDERQGLQNKITNLEKSLDTGDQSLNSQIAEYNQLSAAFKQRLDQFNKEVAYWNTQGGAPPETYQRLKTQQNELKEESDRLNVSAQKLNQSTDIYNSKVSDLNQTVDRFNADLKLKPEEGLYIAAENRIEIYFNNTQKELVHTVAHELGHSRGLDHLENPKAIMYAMTTETLVPTPDELDQLKTICQKRNKLDVFTQRLKAAVTNFRSRS